MMLQSTWMKRQLQGHLGRRVCCNRFKTNRVWVFISIRKRERKEKVGKKTSIACHIAKHMVAAVPIKAVTQKQDLDDGDDEASEVTFLAPFRPAAIDHQPSLPCPSHAKTNSRFYEKKKKI